MKKETIGFAIVGCGTIADWHAKATQASEHGVLVGAYDVNPEKTKEFCEKYGIRPFESMEQLLASDEVDAVCLCTPSGYHIDGAIATIRAGKHILIEKPLALHVEDCERILQEAKAYGVTAGVVSQHRFTPAMETLRQLIESEKLGKIVSVELDMKYYRDQTYYDSGDWRGTWALDGGGALMNQGIHGIDTMLCLLGNVKSVYGMARTLARKIEVEDTSVAVLEFENGALGTMQGTTSVYPGYPRELTVSGTEGTVTIRDNKSFVRWDVKDVPLPEGFVLGEEVRGSASDPKKIGISGHLAATNDFIEAIREGREPAVPLSDGKRAVELITAIYRSSAERKTVFLS